MRSFEEIASTYNTDSLISAIIALQYLGKGELKDSYLIAAEVFASKAIRYNISDSAYSFGEKEHHDLAKLSKKVIYHGFSDYIQKTIQLRDSDASDQEKEEFLQSIMMEAKGSYFRGDGYVHQLIQIAEKLYKPFDEEIKAQFGFTFSCFEAVILYIVQKYYPVIGTLASKTTVKDAIKALWRKITGSSVYTIMASRVTTEYRIYKSDLYARFPQDEVDAIFKELAIIPGECSLDPVGIEDFKPLYGKPFVDFGEYIYLPLPESSLLNLPKLFHYYFVSETCFNKEIRGTYNNVRGAVVEELTIEYLSRLFPKDKIQQSLKYPKKQKTFEADVTVQDSDYTVLAECKAKILVSASLNGSITALKDDVYKAIGKAYEQAIRTVKHIQTGKPFYSEVAAKDVTLQDTAKKYILCVNIEHFGFVPSEIKQYITIDQDIPIPPLAINIYDLDIITAECSDEAEFLQYIEFRVSSMDSLASIDELEAFAYFRQHGMTKIRLAHNSQETIIPLNLMGSIDQKYQPIATAYVLSKSVEYPEHTA